MRACVGLSIAGTVGLLLTVAEVMLVVYWGIHGEISNLEPKYQIPFVIIAVLVIATSALCTAALYGLACMDPVEQGEEEEEEVKENGEF